MKWTINQFEGFGNETKPKNELKNENGNERRFRNENTNGNETHRGNEPEMNRRNELEMNAGNEPEMKTRLEMNEGLEMNKDVEMNQKHITKNNKKQLTKGDTVEYTTEDLIKKIQEIEDNQLRTQLLQIITHEPQFIDINKVKIEIQEGYIKYINGAKFITTEDTTIVLNTIKKDIRIYPNTCRFVVRDFIIDLMLDNNATLYSYYFLNREVLQEVLEQLPTLNIPILKLK